MSEDCKSCGQGSCSAQAQQDGEKEWEYQERLSRRQRLCQIRHKIVVLSGKGGVGKSTVATNLALSLAQAGREVGLLDIDIHGPSVPRLLGLQGRGIETVGNLVQPVAAAPGLKVISMGLVLQDPKDAVVWRGPVKMAAIRQFLGEVDWGRLDYLIIDCPPGTGDEPLSVIQDLEDATGAVIVTTPQEVAVADVRRSITFCRLLKLPVLGIIENMSGLVCPGCGEHIEVFGGGGGERLAAEMGVPFLGRVPLEPKLMAAGDAGMSYLALYPDSEAARAFSRAIAPILALGGGNGEAAATTNASA